MTLNNIPAYCINLDFRQDRWEQVSSEFKKLNWNLQRVSAVPAVYKKKNYPKNPNLPAQIRSPGAVACMKSHRKAWEIVSLQEHPVAAIFEDDAMFPSDFESIFEKAYAELPEDWKIWHLHSFNVNNQKRFFAKRKSMGQYVTKLVFRGLGSHGYLIKKCFAKKLIELSLKTKKAVDTFLTIGLNKETKVYGVINRHTLCFQRAEKSNIRENENENIYYRRLNKNFFR